MGTKRSLNLFDGPNITCSGSTSIPAVSRELLNVVSSCARGVPADAAAWDLSQLQLDGEAVQRETVISWLDDVHTHVLGEAFVEAGCGHEDKQHNKQHKAAAAASEQPDEQQQTAAEATAAAEGQHAVHNQAADEPEPAKPVVSTASCEALTHLLQFADAVGSSRPVLCACAAGCKELKLQVQVAAGTLELDINTAYYIKESTLYKFAVQRRSAVLPQGVTEEDTAVLKQQVQQQLEPLLFLAYKLQLCELTEAVHGFIRMNTSFIGSILHGCLRPILSPRVLGALGGYSSLLEGMLLNTLVTTPVAFQRKPSARHILTPLTSKVSEPIRFTAELAEDFMGGSRGEQVAVELDFLKASQLRLGAPGDSSVHMSRLDAQLLVGPAVLTEQDRQAMLGPDSGLTPEPQT